LSPNEREYVMQYISQKYGADNVVCLGQFSYIWAKGAIKDIGRVLNIPFAETNAMTALLDKETIDEALDLGLLDAYKEKYPELFEYASKLAGLPKSFGSHPCGRVISIRETSYYNALEYSESADSWVLQGDMHTADDLGLVKVDLLGLRTVDVIYDTLEMIGKPYEFVSPRNIDLQDAAVWNEFEQGNTNLIFQFESSGMKGVLRDMKCNCINDLGVANALYRPGAIQYITNYINRKRGEEKITYIHEDLQPILSATYGIIVFQEQLIDIGRYAGLRNPDDLRRATAKKKPELMAKIEPEFRHGLIKQNWLQEQIDKLWNDILEFAKYSFNKSHAIAYALTAYISMHLKVHYPVECMTAFINSYKGDAKGIIKAIAEVQRMGIDFRFDYWRTVQSETTCRDNIIYLGINTLKGFGDNVAPALRAITANNFIDLIKQVKESDINKSQFRTLIKLDFFNEFGRTGKLVNLYDAYQNVYDAKIFTKGRCPVDEKLVAQCSKETAKQYREIDNEKLFNLLCITIKDESIPLNDMIATEIAAKGYITYRDKRLKNYFLVIDMNTKYSPKMKLYSLETGEITLKKTYSSNFAKQPFEKGSIIKALHIEPKPKSQMIDGKWCKILDEIEDWVTSYVVKGRVEIEE
jgi:DNA polymerase III subunit alpha